ncbi:MAG: valine--tRNA ligase [Hyphomicrobiales bacterium]|nr:valine--tRNA ligase [Hyphomicrobiales bacterium]MCY4032670.1 valine--tRNA ligase [Hyphomicrobiales bacterium]
MEKHFDHRAVEPRVYQAWEDSGVFRAGVHVEGGEGKPFCIVLPPPNVTGSLHIGHALNVTLQDILTRWKRMSGYDVLWQPGIDHAGIATQMLVERRLEKEEGLSRRDLGRDAFVERVWQWKAESGDKIRTQMRSLGASCDWERSRFTMDEGLSAAVLKTFVELYRAGLIYKDKRLVNWDPVLRTAISDLEVVATPQKKMSLWHVNYPLEDDTGHITIATTRPETMFADTAIAVHPEDARYTNLVGRYALLPLLGRRLPIIADDYVDPEQGSGALKVTPGHDFNDFEIGRRHDLELVNIFDEVACLNDIAPEEYRGLDRYVAREKLVAELQTLGLIAEVEEREGVIPHGDRSGSVVEPYLTDQWYADAGKLAVEAKRVVREGEASFVPKVWEKTYFDWMDRIEPWCISRQLWWGHRIPAWYGTDGEIFVAHDEDEATALAREHYGDAFDGKLHRDEDVLDTWFSSALWPFSTLGWPDETDELKRYYPTAVLVTSFDIIFFWVARMLMFGMHFQKRIPFHEIYIHALVRDERGQKMSKSKGNVIDPLDAIENYGADALRFTLASLATQGRDIKLSEARIKGYRNFSTKIWNATRFCEMNECREVEGFDPASVQKGLNRWAVGEMVSLSERVEKNLREYRFSTAAEELYEFFWHQFCDWYLEFAKKEFQGEAAGETRACIAWVLKQLLLLLHPFMPYLTEEIHAHRGGKTLLAASPFPRLPSSLRDEASCAQMGWLFGIVEKIRSIRGWFNVPASARVPAVFSMDPKIQPDLQEKYSSAFGEYCDTIEHLCRVEFSEGDRAQDGNVIGWLLQSGGDVMLGQTRMSLFLGGIVDMKKETHRLHAVREKKEKNIEQLKKKMANKEFKDRAPEDVREETRRRLDGLEQEHSELEEVLKSFRL